MCPGSPELAEIELSSFEADAEVSRQTAVANSDSTSTVLVYQFRHQKRAVLTKAITKLRQGVEQLEN